MLDAGAANEQSSLLHIRKVCGAISICFKVILVLICVYWLFYIGGTVWAQINSVSFDVSEGTSWWSMVLYSAYGANSAALILIFISIFSSAAKGDSPFSMVQVKRLRIIAVLLLIYAALESVNAVNVGLMQFDGINSGYISASESAIVAVNFAPIIAAAVIFAFSYVFKYGVLLQEFSDETL